MTADVRIAYDAFLTLQLDIQVHTVFYMNKSIVIYLEFRIIFHEGRFILHIAYKSVERQRICVRIEFPAVSRELIAFNPRAADLQTVVNGISACLQH